VIGEPPGGTRAEPGRGDGPALAAGETVGKYRLDRVIGAGGMGIVWAAFDPDLERAVAIKLLLHAGDGQATLRSRLLREARAMARLKHPNVLTVYEVGTDRNRDYIAMELVDGDSLDVWLASKPPREQVIAALLAAGQGLAAAHEAGLVHRDFKPHNVLRSRSGHVYVTDFGLARGTLEDGVDIEHRPFVVALPDQLVSALRRPLDSLLDSPLTQTGVLVGTPAYMAPEQFAGRVPDARSDQFAFAVAAWEALTGARPFVGDTLPALEQAVLAGARVNEDALPKPMRKVLVRALAPAPADRWPDLPALLAAFAEATPQVKPGKRPRRRRRWALLAVVIAGGAAISRVSNDRHRGGADDEECTSPEAAFGDAWNGHMRDQVAGRHRGGGAIGAIVLLDQARKDWLDTYQEACAEPPSERRVAQLACLTRVRDQIAEMSAQLASEGSAIPMGRFGLLSLDIARCDPDRDPVELDFDDVLPKNFDVPMPSPPTPTPPTPPAQPPPLER
jgi:eukaryotic-like serine/threonine-protein kinase